MSEDSRLSTITIDIIMFTFTDRLGLVTATDRIEGKLPVLARVAKEA
jgi:hypothetical protein